MNTTPGATAEQRYVPTDVFPGGVLPAGVTITEAQGINVLMRIRENLERAGLSYDDVVSMRVFLQNPAGQRRWTSPAGTAPTGSSSRTRTSRPARRSRSSSARPGRRPWSSTRPGRRASRFEIENLPVDGWLVEVEVDAVYPK